MPRLIPPEITANNLPVLDVKADTLGLVAEAHAAALDESNDDVGLLTGAVLFLDNPSPVNAPDTPDKTIFHIGGSTLHEAATEVIGAYGEHGTQMPDWVACTDQQLGEVVAEHFTIKGYHACKIISMEEVSA